MRALSEHVIEGTLSKSPSRGSSLQCHPGTRVQLREKIIAWFLDNRRETALLWLNGPAGVGKTAVIQTIVESLAESKHRVVGATLFFPRLNGPGEYQRVFTTIAYEIATKQPSYREFIGEQITRDPGVFQKGMEEQFRVFITEPFGLKKLEVEGSTLGIFLDGLDGHGKKDDQRTVIRLIAEFVLHFPHTPLVWIIGSRAEPHLTGAFAEDTITASHWSEYVQIGSTEASQDVERYLGEELRVIGRDYGFSHTEFLELSPLRLRLVDYASGFFFVARVAIRYIKDHPHADPLKKLNQLISFLNHAPQNDYNPFALLDALYTSILMTVPPTSWIVTRQILGFVLCVRGAWPTNLSFQLRPHTLAAMSTILDIEESMIYHSLDQLHSVLEIPPPKLARDSGVSFLHDSFADFLMNPARSHTYSIDIGICVEDIVSCLYRVFLLKPWDCEPSSSGLVQSGIECGTFDRNLKSDAEAAFYYTVTGDHMAAQQNGSRKVLLRFRCLGILSQITTSELGFNPTWAPRFNKWLFALWRDFSEEIEDRNLIKEVRLQGLEFDHLDLGKNKPAYVNNCNHFWSPESGRTLEEFIAELRLLQKDSPKTKVLICGSTPERRSIFFSCEYQEQVNDKLVPVERYYCIPYPF